MYVKHPTSNTKYNTYINIKPFETLARSGSAIVMYLNIII